MVQFFLTIHAAYSVIAEISNAHLEKYLRLSSWILYC
jgi:hypothetical protein